MVVVWLWGCGGYGGCGFRGCGVMVVVVVGVVEVMVVVVVVVGRGGGVCRGKMVARVEVFVVAFRSW